MISISQPSLGEAICESIREVFLSASMLPKLMKRYLENGMKLLLTICYIHSKEEEILISTSVLARAVQVVHSRILLEGMLSN